MVLRRLFCLAIFLSATLLAALTAHANFFGIPPWQSRGLLLSSCQGLTSPYKIQRSDDEQLIIGNHLFAYSDPAFDFYFEAHLHEGALTLRARLKDDESLIRSQFSGEKLYKKMIRHFGKKITAINGIWTDGDNFTQFHKNIEAYMSKEDAARNTWSGKMATRHGFTEVTILPLADTQFGQTDGQDWVDVVFTKPQKHQRWRWINDFF